MGTYKRVCIDANTTSAKDLRIIHAALEEYKAGDAWREFTEETKWWPDELVECLSKKLPKVMFRIDLRGEINETYFALDGETVEEGYVFKRPHFPTTRKFNEGKKDKKLNDAALKQRQAREEKARKRKEIRSLEREAKKLKAEL